MYEEEKQNQNIKIFSDKLYNSFTYVAFKRAKIKQYEKIQKERARQALLLKQQKELAQKQKQNRRNILFIIITYVCNSLILSFLYLLGSFCCKN